MRRNYSFSLSHVSTVERLVRRCTPRRNNRHAAQAKLCCVSEERKMKVGKVPRLTSSRLMQRTAVFLEPVIRADRSEGAGRAHSRRHEILLRALAARKMPRERKIQCRRAAGEPAIHAGRSDDQRSNSHFANFSDLNGTRSNSRFRHIVQPLAICRSIKTRMISLSIT